ncbi:MAG: hypothetical protein N2712_02980 [Brevinematales bacterium]|nr:hypothetical protein [Brevinematales bacterium]
MRKSIITILSLVLVFSFFNHTYSQKKQSQKQEKSNRIVVTGPKVKIQKDFTLFESTPEKRPVAIRGSNYVEANIIKFYSAKNYIISEGNVIFKNYEKNIEITSGYSEFYGDTGDVVFMSNPRMYLSNDNLYAGGERVFMNVNEDKVNIETNTFITNQNFRAHSFRTEYASKNNLARMFGDVRVFSTNINIRSDIAFVTIYSNTVSNYIGYGNVNVETKNINSKSEYLLVTFKSSNEIDRYLLLTNVIVDGKDLYVEAFKMTGIVSNVIDGNTTNELKFYIFTGGQKQVYYQNKKESTVLECDLLEVIMDKDNEMISSTAKGRVKVIK